MDLAQFRIQAQNQKKENQIFYRKLAAKPPRQLDSVVHQTHDEIFENTDCLSCANCCKTTSPIFYQRDIERAAKALRLRPGDFIEKYLRIDEEDDYVLKSSPCAFLGADNYCSIYDDRPNACREYPHTNRKKVHQLLNLTYHNTLVCPAVLKITEQLKKSSIQGEASQA
jgi:Fe-S-cluster containining protein